MRSTIFLLLAAALLAGCSSMPRSDVPDYAALPIVPENPADAPVAPGTIYREGWSFDLFMDLRARAVGDILTIELVERTNATKESSTNTARGTSLDTGLPVIAGGGITAAGRNILNNEVSTDNSFSGESDASQSNRLDGSITVTVAGRMPNGNLLVQGEKWITLNQGQEFIRLTGVVRPVDIGPDNSVLSTKVADAKITYSGKGTLADANRPGILTRFFNLPWMPF